VGHPPMAPRLRALATERLPIADRRGLGPRDPRPPLPQGAHAVRPDRRFARAGHGLRRRRAGECVGAVRGHNLSVLVSEAYDALAAARHADPFSILGPHGGDGAVVIRAFHPSAEAIDVVYAGGARTMARVHGGGVFEARFAGAGDVFD